MKQINHLKIQSFECPDSGQLLRYAKGEASSDEMNRIERHLEICEICNAELEGILLLDNPGDIHTISSDLNKRIDTTLIDKKTKKYNFVNYRWIAAASFLLLVSGTYFILNHVFVEKKQIESARKDQFRSIEPGRNKITGKDIDTLEKAPSLISYSKNKDYEQVFSISREQIDILMPGEKNITTNDSISNLSDLKYISVADAEEYLPETTVLTDRAEFQEKDEMKADKKEKLVDQAGAQLNQQSSKKIRTAKDTEMDEKTLWDKAIKLIQEDKPREAKIILKQIIDFHGSYEDSAKQKLKTL